MVSPLVCCFCPRDNSLFYAVTQTLNYDKIFLKYMPLDKARRIARNFFLSYNKWDYLVILTDDLITSNVVFDKLIADIEKGHYKIISGWCNGNVTFGSEDTDFSFVLPPDPPFTGSYEQYHFTKIRDITDILGFNLDLIIPVKHQGFNPSFIHKDIVEMIPFRVSGGCCSDSCFSLDLDKQGIEQYIDLSCRSYHMKEDDKFAMKDILVGIRPEEFYFVNKKPYNEDISNKIK